MNETTPNLHVFAQPFWHCPAYLVGNAAALRNLRDAIDKALNTVPGVGITDAYVIDGEGYEVVVAVVPHHTMELLATAYLDDIANGGNTAPLTVFPHDLPAVKEAYDEHRRQTQAAYDAKREEKE